MTAVQHMSAILLLLVVELLYATKFNYPIVADELLQLSHTCTHYMYAFMLSYLALVGLQPIPPKLRGLYLSRGEDGL